MWSKPKEKEKKKKNTVGSPPKLVVRVGHAGGRKERGKTEVLT